MTTEERLNQQGENTVSSNGESQEMVAVKSEQPPVPKGVTNEESRELKDRAADVVRQLEDASGSEALELITSITTVGTQAQRNAGTELELLRTCVGEVLTREGPGGEVSKNLVDLRLTLNQINPHEVGHQGFLRRAFGVLPFVGKSTSVMRVLEKIAIRYEPVAQQVTVIETKLREGQTMLARDNVEFRKLYEQVEAQHLPIQKNAYLGELLINHLDDLLEHTEDVLKTERIRNAVHDVSMRVQDLRTMEEVHIQFFVSIEMTRQNNTRLGQSVERTLSLGSNVVMVGLAIQTALARQQRVLEANRRTREFLGNLIVANAAAIKQHTQEIGDVYNKPVLAIEKITQAHSDLIEAMNTSDRLKQEGIDSARENIAKLTEMSSDLEERSRGLREQREADARSIEA